MRALVILLMLLFIPSVSGFGSVTTRDELTWSGGSPSFTVFLYSSDENETVHLSFSSDVPNGWEAVVDHPELTIEPGIGKEIISTPAGPIHAQAITMTVTPPPQPIPGIYQFTLKALQKEQSTGVAIRQERQFPFSLIISGTPPQSGEKPPSESPPSQNPPGIPTEGTGGTLFWVILILIGIIGILKILRYI